MIVHNVYFTLHEPSAELVKALVLECQKWLPGHEGIRFFAAGTLCPDLRREVNDLDYHVALHIVFSDMSAHDAYQVSDSHKAFIERNKSGWKKVRVFDSTVA